MINHRLKQSYLITPLFWTIVYLGFGGVSIVSAIDNNNNNIEEITAAVPRFFPPQYLVNSDGKPGGFAIEVMNEVAHRAGLKVNYRIEDSWSEVNHALNNGLAQIVPNNGITKQRKKTRLFTRPYESFFIKLFIHTSRNDIHSLEDLVGQRVGTLKSNVGEQIISQHPGIELRLFDTTADVIRALIADNIDGLVLPEPTVLRNIIELEVGDQITSVGKPLKTIKRGIAVVKGQEKLRDRLDAVLAEYLESQEFQDTYYAWFGTHYVPINSKLDKLKIWVIGFILFVLIVGFYKFIKITKKTRPSANIDGGHHRVITLVFIFISITMIISGFTLWLLYETAFEESRHRLVEIAKSRARLIESVAQFDLKHYKEGGSTSSVRDGTLQQIKNAHKKFHGFGTTGEFTLAERVGNYIQFVLSHRHSIKPLPEKVLFQSNLAEPMRRALSRRSGTIVGLDYRGVTVLAAYEPVAILNMGIVAKIDLSEIRKPFIQSAFIVVVFGMILILLGSILFFRITNPLLRNLWEREAFISSIVNDLPALVCRNKPDGKIEFVNKAYCDYFGKTAEQLIGTNFYNLIPKNEHEMVRNNLSKLSYDIPVLQHEHQVIDPGSNKLWQRWTNRAICDEQRRVILLVAYGEDITQSKINENKLREQAVLLEEMGQLAKIGAWEFDVKSGEGTWTEQVSWIHDMTTDEMTNKQIGLEFYQGKYREAIEQAIEEAIEQGKPYDLELQLTTRKNKKKWVRTIGKPISDDGKKITKIRGSIQDITEKKDSENKLKRSEAFLKTIIEKSPFPMWVSDKHGYLLSINRACRTLLHINKEEVIGKYNVLKDNIVKEQNLLPQVESVYQQGKQVNYKIKWAAENLKGLDFADSIPVELDVTITPIVDDNGKTTNAIIQIIDITKLKKVERELSIAFEHMEKKVVERTQELSLANKRLKELDQLKSLFIASMSHELRTPLNSIIGFTGVMLMEKMGTLNDKQRDYLERVSASGKHLLNLITDVIDVSKIEAGKIDIYPEIFNLLTLVEEAYSILLKDVEEKGLSIRINIPNITLNTDKKRLLQCLLNCLSNAVKYSETGEICISAVTEGNNITINVKDQGIGISDEDIDKIFLQFSRIDSPLTRSTPGTGLGLYLTKMMVTQILDGELGVESHLGKGSNFWMKIPMELTT